MNRLLRIPWLIAFSQIIAASAQQVVPFDASDWQVQAAESRVEEHLGRPSLYLKGGTAWLPDADFTDGVIEFDVAFGPERNFLGAVWRATDAGNYEHFYIRPHQSGHPDANQYTPVFNGVSGWQLYFGDGYASPTTYAFDRWTRVRIVVSGSRGEIFIDDMDKPAIAVHEMKHAVASGAIGLQSGNLADSWYSNFRYRKQSGAELTSQAEAPGETPAGTISNWAVSEAFAESSVSEAVSIGMEELRASRHWKSLESESNGVTNLARVARRTQDADTAWACVRIDSEQARTALLRLGFSDRVRVYLNGEILYAGGNEYRSRDYRYLGTIGLFDRVALPLKAGSNELWLAVSEDFGGWGIVARLPADAGLRVTAEP